MSTLCGESSSPIRATSTRPLTDAIAEAVEGPLDAAEASTYLGRTMIIQADHGASAAALALRVSISTGSELKRSLLAAMSVFAGPLHGGAIRDVVELLEEQSPEAVARKRTGDGRPVPGFGHRVYKRVDPRVAPLQEIFDEVRAHVADDSYGSKLDALRHVMHTHERAGSPPNVDLYAGPTWRLLGLRSEQLLAVFVAARTAGWIAHAIEQAEADVLIRPNLKYIGEPHDQ